MCSQSVIVKGYCNGSITTKMPIKLSLGIGIK